MGKALLPILTEVKGHEVPDDTQQLGVDIDPISAVEEYIDSLATG